MLLLLWLLIVMLGLLLLLLLLLLLVVVVLLLPGLLRRLVVECGCVERQGGGHKGRKTVWLRKRAPKCLGPTFWWLVLRSTPFRTSF
jgi:hypothetical protein